MSYWVTIRELRMFITLYESGFTGHEIAACTGRPISTIYTHLHRAGVKMRPRGQRADMGDRIDHKAIARTVLLYQAGYSTEEVGRMLGVAQSTVRYRLQQAGTPRRSRAESAKLHWARQPKARPK